MSQPTFTSTTHVGLLAADSLFSSIRGFNIQSRIYLAPTYIPSLINYHFFSTTFFPRHYTYPIHLRHGRVDRFKNFDQKYCILHWQHHGSLLDRSNGQVSLLHQKTYPTQPMGDTRWMRDIAGLKTNPPTIRTATKDFVFATLTVGNVEPASTHVHIRLDPGDYQQ